MKTAILTAGLAAVAGASREPVHVSGPKNEWTVVKRAPKNVLKTFGVAMKMSNFEELERQLEDISNPKSKNYGRWLTKSEADLLTATKPEIVAEVKQWAQSTGAQCRQTAPEALSCQGKVHQIEKLLSTELSVHKHKKSGKTIIRTSAPATVPKSLEGKVLFVEGLTKLPVARLGSVTAAKKTEAGSDDDPTPTPSGPDYVIVPETLIHMYNVSVADGSAASTQGAAEFQGYPAPDLTAAGDLGVFSNNTATPFWSVAPANIIGPFSVSPSAESTLDAQYLGAIGQGNTNYYYTFVCCPAFDFSV
jgi:tripeptidyl-peptidase I